MKDVCGHYSGLRVLLLTIFASLVLTAVIPSSVAHAATLDSEEVALCRMVNAHRAQNGLPPLLVSNTLGNAAEWLSTDMAQKNYFNHVDSLGRTSSQRMAAFGYSYATPKGENIAAGSSTASGTFTQWKSSSLHNANMLSTNYRVMGIGRAYGTTSQYGWYWTNTFGGYNDGGTPCPTPSALAVNDVSVTEGNSGTTLARFTISRSGATAGPSSVRFATANGTATAGTTTRGDYHAVPPTTVSFAAGETAKVVTVTVNGDVVPEAAERFYVNLSSPTGATISDGSGTGTILNDDSPATLAVDNVRVIEGNSGTTSATFTITRTVIIPGVSSVRYATVNGTATAGVDYVAKTLKTVTFAVGETTKNVIVTVNGDTTVEPSETFFLKLSAATGATIRDATGAATIQKDDMA